MKILLDTNVILDLFLDRHPFSDHAATLFSLIETSRMEGLICATTLTTIDYLLKQKLPRNQAQKALKKLLDLFEVAPVNRPVLEQALQSKVTDFEDAMLEQAAALVNADAIITRNVKDFKKSTVPAYDPVAFLAGFNMNYPEA